MVSLLCWVKMRPCGKNSAQKAVVISYQFFTMLSSHGAVLSWREREREAVEVFAFLVDLHCHHRIQIFIKYQWIMLYFG